MGEGVELFQVFVYCFGYDFVYDVVGGYVMF